MYFKYLYLALESNFNNRPRVKELYRFDGAMSILYELEYIDNVLWNTFSDKKLKVLHTIINFNLWIENRWIDSEFNREK